MSSRTRSFLMLALGTVVAGCAHNPTPSDVGTPDASRITRAEMEQARYASLYEVVQALRGRWLTTRGPKTLLGTPSEVQVLLDDMRMGGVDALRTLQTDNVVSISFVDPVTAAQRWGGKFAQGTIVVTTHADASPNDSSRIAPVPQ
jgi:hypothetical protein